jgi:hypothetical protein
VIVDVPGLTIVIDGSVKVALFTLIYEIVPGKFSLPFLQPPIVTGPLVDITYALVLLIAVFVAVCVPDVATFVSNVVNDVGVRFIFRM